MGIEGGGDEGVGGLIKKEDSKKASVGILMSVLKRG